MILTAAIWLCVVGNAAAMMDRGSANQCRIQVISIPKIKESCSFVGFGFCRLKKGLICGEGYRKMKWTGSPGCQSGDLIRKEKCFVSCANLTTAYLPSTSTLSSNDIEVSGGRFSRRALIPSDAPEDSTSPVSPGDSTSPVSPGDSTSPVSPASLLAILSTTPLSDCLYRFTAWTPCDVVTNMRKRIGSISGSSTGCDSRVEETAPCSDSEPFEECDYSPSTWSPCENGEKRLVRILSRGPASCQRYLTHVRACDEEKTAQETVLNRPAT